MDKYYKVNVKTLIVQIVKGTKHFKNKIQKSMCKAKKEGIFERINFLVIRKICKRISNH